MVNLSLDGQQIWGKRRYKCHYGSGDDRHEFHFDEIEFQGRTCLLLLDAKERWLYCLSSQNPDWQKTTTTHEQLPSVEFEGRGSVAMRWATLETPFEVDDPLWQNSRHIMIVGDQLYRALPLDEVAPNQFFTAFFPTASLPRTALLASAPVHLHTSLIYGGLATLVALGLALGNPGLGLRIFWWLGPIFMCLVSLPGFGLLAAAFGFHFMTHGLDFAVSWLFPRWDLNHIEACHVVLTFLGLTWLSWSQPRAYRALEKTASQGGGCCWLVFASGIFFWSIVDEFNWFAWFSETSAYWPWASLWLLVLIAQGANCWQDYAQVPLTQRGFFRRLAAQLDLLSRGLDEILRNHQAIAASFNDLQQCFEVTRDPGLLAYQALAAPLARCQLLFSNLKELSEADYPRAQQDLALLQQDWQEILQALPQRPAQVLSPRLSPFLMTLNA